MASCRAAFSGNTSLIATFFSLKFVFLLCLYAFVFIFFMPQWGKIKLCVNQAYQAYFLHAAARM